MPKINIYLPDDLADAVKAAGVPVSAVCQRALEQAVRRVTAIRELGSGSPYREHAGSTPALPFTKRAMTVLQTAQATATDDGLAKVSSEHLLLALVSGDDNMAVRVLGALEITPRDVRVALDRRLRTNPETAARQSTSPDGAPAEPRLDAEATTAVELAANESSGLGNGYIGCEHVLLGLIGEPAGTAGSVLRSLGADLRVTRRTVAAALAGWGAGFSAHEQRTSGPTELTALIRSELAPLLARIEELETRPTAAAGG